MALRKTSSSFSKILLIVFGAAFGLVALALGYQAVKDSSDIRSRAATEGDVYRTWEFLSDKEGWKATGGSADINNGALSFVISNTKKIPSLVNTSVETDMPQGKKYIAMYLALEGSVAPKLTPTMKPVQPPVTPMVGIAEKSIDTSEDLIACTLDAKLCLDGTFVGRVAPSCAFSPCKEDPIGNVPTLKVTPGLRGQPVTLEVYYKLSGQKWSKTPLLYEARLTNAFQRISLALPETLPEIGPAKVEGIRVVFASGLGEGQTVRIDRIQLLGARIRIPSPMVTRPVISTPTPSPLREFTLAVSGQQPVAQQAKGIPLTMTVSEPDKSPGTPTEGFNVQVYVLSLPSKTTVSGHNAQYDAESGTWKLTVVAPTPGSYRFQIAAYCAVDTSICAGTYGKAKQVMWEYDFRVIGLPTTTINPAQ